MRIVIFGLTISSSWGNGHATLWRGLIRALSSEHHVVFFERDVPYYAAHRDLASILRAELVLFDDWDCVRKRVQELVRAADAAIVTSYCPDAVEASRLILSECPGLRVFYDLDTPVTLAQLATGATVPYLPPEGLRDFDLVLSYTGGRALDEVRNRLGARRVAPLYGHVDPDVHRPVARVPQYRAALSYLGTYSRDRQSVVEQLFVQPARQRPHLRFVLGGSGYPDDFPWTQNLYFVHHVAPPDHAAFFSSSRLTLNVTRADMAAFGHCPSGRLFEAAACGTPLLTDAWRGLEQFFSPGEEILVAGNTEDVLNALAMTPGELRCLAGRARARALEEHSSTQRARELIRLLQTADARPQHAAVAGDRQTGRAPRPEM